MAHVVMNRHITVFYCI